MKKNRNELKINITERLKRLDENYLNNDFKKKII